MFSLFSKKPKFSVKIKDYSSELIACGLWTEVGRKTVQKDVASVQQRFQSLRPQIDSPSNPSGTIVISRPVNPNGSFSYFIGDLTDNAEQKSDFAVERLKCGKYAHITVDFKDSSQLTLAVAKAKRYFFTKWLPESDYIVCKEIESIELYDRRSNIAFASMELIFPLISK